MPNHKNKKNNPSNTQSMSSGTIESVYADPTPQKQQSNLLLEEENKYDDVDKHPSAPPAYDRAASSPALCDMPLPPFSVHRPALSEAKTIISTNHPVEIGEGQKALLMDSIANVNADKVKDEDVVSNAANALRALNDLQTTYQHQQQMHQDPTKPPCDLAMDNIVERTKQANEAVNAALRDGTTEVTMSDHATQQANDRHTIDLQQVSTALTAALALYNAWNLMSGSNAPVNTTAPPITTPSVNVPATNPDGSISAQTESVGTENAKKGGFGKKFSKFAGMAGAMATMFGGQQQPMQMQQGQFPQQQMNNYQNSTMMNNQMNPAMFSTGNSKIDTAASLLTSAMGAYSTYQACKANPQNAGNPQAGMMDAIGAAAMMFAPNMVNAMGGQSFQQQPYQQQPYQQQPYQQQQQYYQQPQQQSQQPQQQRQQLPQQASTTTSTSLPTSTTTTTNQTTQPVQQQQQQQPQMQQQSNGMNMNQMANAFSAIGQSLAGFNQLKQTFQGNNNHQ